jgi:hypothetical protein
MKTLIRFLFFVSLMYSLSGCVAVATMKTGPGNSSQAPGQVKKATGAKSAKQYAPGQKKKN